VTEPAQPLWPQADGTPVSCREKLRMLEENHAELQGVLRDAFEDAVLMGVDETAMRRILVAMVESLESPKRAVSAGGGPVQSAPAQGGQHQA
jgi:hypothetical protein